jgi:hypothetical protein
VDENASVCETEELDDTDSPFLYRAAAVADVRVPIISPVLSEYAAFSMPLLAVPPER